MENAIVGRLYYNRNKSHSYHNLGISQSTKNKKIFSPMISKDNLEEELYKSTKNYFGENETTQNFVKKKSFGGNINNNMNDNINNINVNSNLNDTKRIKLNDFNAFLEKLSNYENKKNIQK